jgi:ribonuclease Z
LKGKSIRHNGKTISPKSLCYKEKGRKITFILDTADNKNTTKIAKNSDLLISEASFLDSEKLKAQDYLHLTAKQAATIAKKSKSQALILTHISQRHEHNESEILEEAKSVFKNTKIASDFDKIII